MKRPHRLYNFESVDGVSFKITNPIEIRPLLPTLKLLGIQIPESRNFKIFKEDFTLLENSGNTIFKEDGIYVMIDGIEHKGYLYMPKYFIEKYNDHPRFHILECITIEAERKSGDFTNRYYFSNNKTVDVTDRTSLKIYSNLKLNICKNCSSLSKQRKLGVIKTTEEFFSEIAKVEEAIIKTDKDGYPIHPISWRIVSRKYREHINYQCENRKCKIQLEGIDKRYIHVHHKNGIKIDCDFKNLEGLCILCHSVKDATHMENFKKRKMSREFQTFLKKYGEELKGLGNPYLNSI